MRSFYHTHLFHFLGTYDKKISKLLKYQSFQFLIQDHFKWILLDRNTYRFSRAEPPVILGMRGLWHKETVKSHDWLDSWATIFTNSTPDTFPKNSIDWSQLKPGSARLEHLQTFTSFVHGTLIIDRYKMCTSFNKHCKKSKEITRSFQHELSLLELVLFLTSFSVRRAKRHCNYLIFIWQVYLHDNIWP